MTSVYENVLNTTSDNVLKEIALAQSVARTVKPLPTAPREGLGRVLALRPGIEAFATDVVKKGLSSVYLLGSGGGYLTHNGLQYLFEQRSSRFPSFQLSANEFI